MKVFSSIKGALNASHFYRQIQPMLHLHKAGLADCILDSPEAGLTDHERITGASYADINLFYQPIDSNFQVMLESCTEWPSRWESETEWNTPPSFVIDTDDDLFNVHPTNSAFRNLGIRVNGEEMKPGAVISIENEKGERVPLFEDGKKGFDVARNLEKLRQYRHNLRIAGLVTCSTPRSQAYVLREVPEANTLVIPNCIDFGGYPSIELADRPSKVRIMWQGSTTHLEDLFPYKQAIGDILRANPHVELLIWGAKYVWPEWPADQVVFEPWHPYTEYKLWLSTRNHDINLCFLSGDIFGLSRSAIKWYESSAICKPAATLAPRVGVFADEIDDGQTALLYDNQEDFKTKLQGLIDDATLRQTLAANAKDWIRTHRDPAKWAVVHAEAFAGLRSAKKLAWAPPPKEIVLANSIPTKQPDLR